MASALPEQDEILSAIKKSAEALGHAPSRSEFHSRSGITDYQVLRLYPSWREAVRAAGCQPDESNLPLEPAELWQDWADLIRRLRRIPTRDQYRREGTFSPQVYEKKFGPWSTLPNHFRIWASDQQEWADVVVLLPARAVSLPAGASPAAASVARGSTNGGRYAALPGRPTYGDPIDFRGLRHEPVNEQGVVFLFGMVARELGFLVEAVQAGYPDCEAKRQVAAGKWQRVRIEFEFESRNFRDHGHSVEGCDVIVCWRHNWPECPERLEVVELHGLMSDLSSIE